jgi:hypothetical protein
VSEIPKFLKRSGDKLLYNGEGYLGYYVPELYFERGAAISEGEYIHVFGLFLYGFFSNSDKRIGEPKVFNHPTSITCKPTEITKLTNETLTKNLPSQGYRLLKFKKDGEAISSVLTEVDITNAEILFRLFNSGKLPNIIPYDELHELFIDNIKLCKQDYGLTSQIFGLMISESCRSVNDIRKRFSHTDMKDMTAYQIAPVKEIPKYISPAAAITSENFDEGVVNAMMIKTPQYTPMEKILMEQSYSNVENT